MPDPAPTMITAIGLVLLSGLLVGCGGPVLLRRLPEPAPPAGADEQTLGEYRSKIDYADLATARFAVVTGALAAAGMTVAVICQPSGLWPYWLIISTVGVLLAAVDARSTWLPIGPTYAGWIGMLLAIGVSWFIGPPDGISTMLTVLAGAVIAGVGYFLLWRVTGGRGVAFGDVRLMPVIGAVGGSMGWSGIYWTILLGSVVGGLIGVARLLRRRRGAFAYAPALISGPYAAAVLSAVG